VAVLNADDPLVDAMADRTTARVTRFGTGPAADVRVEDVRLDELDRATYDLVVGDQRRTVRLGLIGEHHAQNTAAVAAAALALGVPLDDVTDALSTATATSPARMQLVERADGVTVINDAYNANPDSMRAALKSLAAIGRARPGARTIAVLGEMLELGSTSREEHDAVGRLAVRLDINQLVVVGEGAKPVHLGACLEGSWGGESVFVPDPDAATGWLREHLRPGDVVLFKSSKAAQVRAVAETVIADGAGPADEETDR
jgi:UDP-N-acetylmuramoyl-tripeptide--D-alanyl-D-alanine ligase